MIKTILYTTNPSVNSTFEDVEEVAAMTGKYFSCVAKQGSKLYGLKPGAHVLTQKGNDVYVLAVYEGHQEFDDAKKSNITGVVNVDYPFGEPDGDLFDDLKDTFAFNKVDDVKLSINGQLCVRTANGYVTINDNNELVRYPKAMVIDVPVYVMPKAKKEIQSGDVIVVGDSYAKVLRTKDHKIVTISYKGASKTVFPIKDFLMNETFVQVVVSPLSNMTGGTINPMMLALAGGSDDLLPLMLMQNGQNINPMMLMLLNKKNKDNDMMKTMLMMQAFGGQNPFAAPAEPVETTDDPIEDVVVPEADIEE